MEKIQTEVRNWLFPPRDSWAPGDVKRYACDDFTERSDGYVNILVTLGMLSLIRVFSVGAHAAHYGHLLEWLP